MAPSTPGIARTRRSASARIGSRSRARSAGTVIENMTLPPETKMSDTSPRATMSPRPSGAGIGLRRSRTWSLVMSGMG